jgi:hypothetical protein
MLEQNVLLLELDFKETIMSRVAGIKETPALKQKYAKLEPKERAFAKKADLLCLEAARAEERTKTGSPKAASLITRANVFRQKAGLIKGKLLK